MYLSIYPVWVDTFRSFDCPNVVPCFLNILHTTIMANKFTLPKPKIGSANTHETESVGAFDGVVQDAKDQVNPFGSDFFQTTLRSRRKKQNMHLHH